MHVPSRRALFLAFSMALPLLSWLAPAPVQAQSSWPTGKSIRLIVPYPAAGVTDAVARLVGDRLGTLLETPVVIDNRPGAAGLIGMDMVAKAPADGYTLGLSSVSTLALTPHLGTPMPFDPARDILPVVNVVYSPTLIMATPTENARDFAALLAEARARPGAIRWSTTGQGSLGHIMLEQIKYNAGVDILHIPYKGSNQQLTEAMSGLMEIASSNATQTLMQQIQTGKLRPLAVAAKARMELLPNVPTMAEVGFANANRASVFGVFAPARTPPAIVEKVNAAVNKLLAQPDVRRVLLEQGNVPTGGSVADFARDIATESALNAAIITSAHIKVE